MKKTLKNFIEFNGYFHDLNIKLLENFNYKLIKEGLIRSVDYDIAVEKLKKLVFKYKLKGQVKLYFPYEDRIEINIYGVSFIDKKSFYNEFKSLLNLLGYYVSSYVNEYLDTIKKDIPFSVFNDYDEITIWLNKKFDFEKGVPIELFHLTQKKHINKINKQGLIPKSKNVIEKHPDRIYLFLDEEDAKNFTVLKDLYSYSDVRMTIDDFILLKIDTRLLKNLKLYEDPKFDKNIIAFYTYDNISPNAISVIEI